MLADFYNWFSRYLFPSLLKEGIGSVQQTSARHIAIVRSLCGLGEQFSVAALYHCRCGEIAVQDEFSKDFVGLKPGGSNRQIERCALSKLN